MTEKLHIFNFKDLNIRLGLNNSGGQHVFNNEGEIIGMVTKKLVFKNMENSGQGLVLPI